MAIHRALKKASSPRTSPAKRTKRVAAAVSSAKRTTRSPSIPRKSRSPSSSSSSTSTSTSSAPKRRSSPTSKFHRHLSREERKLAIILSPAIASYTDAKMRCSHCRTQVGYDDRAKGFGLFNIRRHLDLRHPDEVVVRGPHGEFILPESRHMGPLEGEEPLELAGPDDYEREAAGTKALAAQDEADKKDAAETLLSFSDKLVLFTASEIPPRFRVASDEQL